MLPWNLIVSTGFASFMCPPGLTFSWWGCYGFCPRHKPTELAPSFLFSSCVCFCLYNPFNCISFHKFSPKTPRFLTLFFWSYFCLSGLFNYISLSETLPQPWRNPLWLTGLKAPTNQLTSLMRDFYVTRSLPILKSTGNQLSVLRSLAKLTWTLHESSLTSKNAT